MTIDNAGVVKVLDVFQPSATYKAEDMDRLRAAFSASTIIEMCDWAYRNRRAVHFLSDPGVGKTSAVLNYFRSQGLNVLLLHTPTLDLDRLIVPMPVTSPVTGQKVLQPLVAEELMNADVVVLDEPYRAKPSVRQAAMELVQEKSISGIPLKKDPVFIVCNNYAGEAGVLGGGTDLAQETRYVTVQLTAADVPWKVALAATFKDHDLSKVFKLYDELEVRYPGVTKYLSPRTLEHVLFNAINGLPPVLGLPLMAGPRAELKANLKSKGGVKETVVTKEVLSSICAALGEPYTEPSAGTSLRALEVCLREGKNIMIQGNPGVGKTSYIKNRLNELGINHKYWSMQNVNPDEHVVPFPTEEGKLELMVSEFLSPADGKGYWLVADEFYRSKPQVQNIMLEVTQGGSIGGRKIPVQGVIALTNPREIAGVRQEVGIPDRAQADRFFCSVRVAEDEIPAGKYLVEKYGDLGQTFVDWRAKDLEAGEKLVVNMRVLETMLKLWKDFVSLDALTQAFPVLSGERKAVSLIRLDQRLRNLDVFSLKRIAEDGVGEQLVNVLRGLPATESDPVPSEAEITVLKAKLLQMLTDADSETLAAHLPLAIKLTAFGDQQTRMLLLRRIILNGAADPGLSSVVTKLSPRAQQLRALVMEDGVPYEDIDVDATTGVLTNTVTKEVYPSTSF